MIFRDYRDARDITGVGTAAYFYIDSRSGPRPVVHFGNAHIDLSVLHTGRAKSLPSGIEDRLIITAKPR